MMNRLELAYSQQLNLLLLAGELLEWRFEPLSLRLAPNTFYRPDFLVVPAEAGARLEFHEVKGYWEDDARVKVKVAADRFPFFRFIAATRPRGGSWKLEEIG